MEPTTAQEYADRAAQLARGGDHDAAATAHLDAMIGFYNAKAFGPAATHAVCAANCLIEAGKIDEAVGLVQHTADWADHAHGVEEHTRESVRSKKLQLAHLRAGRPAVEWDREVKTIPASAFPNRRAVEKLSLDSTWPTAPDGNTEQPTTTTTFDVPPDGNGNLVPAEPKSPEELAAACLTALEGNPLTPRDILRRAAEAGVGALAENDGTVRFRETYPQPEGDTEAAKAARAKAIDDCMIALIEALESVGLQTADAECRDGFATGRIVPVPPAAQKS